MVAISFFRRIAFFALALVILWSANAEASCNVIPGVSPRFRGTRGSTDRPFAGPGDTIRIGSHHCVTQGPTFADPLQNGGKDANGTLLGVEDFVATLIFKPGGGEPKRVVVLAASCDSVVLSPTCGSLPGEKTICIDDRDLRKLVKSVDGKQLKLTYPHGICTKGTRLGMPCTRDAQCSPGLRQPGLCTPAAEARSEQAHALAGPVTLVVTGVGSNLSPCDLVSTKQRCDPNENAVACVDAFYPDYHSCEQDLRHDFFPSFTALPPPNVFAELCTPQSEKCRGDMDSELQFALDERGDVLLPFDWKGIGSSWKLQAVHVSTSIPAWSGQLGPIKLPSRKFTSAYSPNGRPLPALFEPDSESKRVNEMSLYGVTDGQSRSVLRFSSRIWTDAACPEDASKSCDGDAACAGGVCGSAPLFVLDDRSWSPVGGPVRLPRRAEGPGVCDQGGSTALPDGEVCTDKTACSGAGECVDLRLEAGAVDNHGWINFSAFKLVTYVVKEDLINHDLNGRDDKMSPVLLIRDKKSAAVLPYGASSECPLPTSCSDPRCDLPPGRAVVRSRDDSTNYDVEFYSNGVIRLGVDCSEQPRGSCRGIHHLTLRRDACLENGTEHPRLLAVHGSRWATADTLDGDSAILSEGVGEFVQGEHWQIALRDPPQPSGWWQQQARRVFGAEPTWQLRSAHDRSAPWTELGPKGPTPSLEGNRIAIQSPAGADASQSSQLRVIDLSGGSPVEKATFAIQGDYILGERLTRHCEGLDVEQQLLAFQPAASSHDARLSIVDLAAPGRVGSALATAYGDKLVDCDGALCEGAPYALTRGGLRYFTSDAAGGITANFIDGCDPAVLALRDPPSQAKRIGQLRAAPMRYPVDERVTDVILAGRCKNSRQSCFKGEDCEDGKCALDSGTCKESREPCEGPDGCPGDICVVDYTTVYVFDDEE